MPLEKNHSFLTLCETQTCSLLRGNVDLKWAGHTVKLRGILHKLPPRSHVRSKWRERLKGRKLQQFVPAANPGARSGV